MKSNLRLLFPVIKTPRQPIVVRGCSYSSDVREIKIPKRIPRGPTDILKALSGTVGIDPTAAHYKFHDDPYLIPYSNPSKRSYALSQEAGRKAAQWIRQQHSDLFQHKVADPQIEAFVPKAVYNDESNVNEETLQSLISTQQVSDVITVIGILTKREIDISVATKQKILELVCFYNCQDPLSDEWVEENWFKQLTHGKTPKGEMGKKTWKDDGFAEAIFEQIIQGGGDVSKAHCALISGMLTHGQVDRAWKLYEECKQNGIELNVDVYNALLAKSTFLRESHDMVWQLIIELLTEMKSLGIRPNLQTLNNTLISLEFSQNHKNARMNALSVVAEFKTLGIEPSLASFGRLIRIFQRDQSRLSGLIRNMLDLLEKDPSYAEPKSPDDSLFFARAMEAISNKLADKALAERLDSVLHNIKNYTLIGNSFNESIYYRHYFTLMMNSTEIDEFMDFYYKFVPNLYIPEINVTGELMNMIEAQMGWEHVPKIWSDLMLFEQLRTNLVEKLLSLTVQAATEDPEQAAPMAEVAWSVWQKLQDGSAKSFEWTGEMLGDILNVLSTGKELAKANIIMDRIDRVQNSVTGEPAVASLVKYVEACLEVGNIDGALRCAKYCDSRELPITEEITNKIKNSGHKLEGPQERIIYELQRHLK